jgi:ankyrin repeat protein
MIEDEDESPQSLLMGGACSDDPDEGIRLIDEAMALGADFVSEGVEPLFYAAVGRRARVLTHLIARGATLAGEWPNNAKPFEDVLRGETALHAAAARGDCECLRILLAADGGAFLNTFSELGWTPLICAVRAGHAAAVQLLIKAGADVNARDETTISNPAIREAVEAGHLGIVQMLLDRGADPTLPGWMMLTAVHKAQLGGTRTAPMLELFRSRLAVSEARWKALLLPEKRGRKRPAK